MKFTRLYLSLNLKAILLFTLLSFSLQVDTYTLAIYGNNGQVEDWVKHKMPDIRPIEQERDFFYREVFYNEKFIVEPFKCIKKEKKYDYDLTKKCGLENFNQILANQEAARILKDADGAVFIGGILDLETEHPFELEPDRTDPKLLTYNIHSESGWQARLDCGWNLFFESLQRVGLAKLKKDSNLKKPGKVILDSKVELLAGKSSQDFNLFREEKQVRSVLKEPITKPNPLFKEERVQENDKVFTESPSLIRIKFGTFDIEFLDFNSSNFSCIHSSTRQDYTKCTSSPKTVTLKQARIYAWRLAEYIKKFTLVKDGKNEETRRVWRVMRATHPPLNSVDGDADFYFNDIKTVDPATQKEGKVNLWNLMKQMKVNVFFGSYLDSAQVLALPYNYAFKKLNTDKCEDPYESGCAVSKKDNLFLSDATLSPKCTDELKYTLPINARHDLNNDMLYVFIFGNSGRSLKNFRLGKFSVGVLIWARAKRYEIGTNYKDGFGFAVAKFSNTSIGITFYENSPESKKLINAAEITVSNGTLPDMFKVGHYIDGKICPPIQV